MHWLSFSLGIFLVLFSIVGSFPLNWGSTMEPIIGLYGETIMVPCRFPPGNNPVSTRWKHVRDDGTTNNLLYDDPRVTVSDGSSPSLRIAQGTWADQGLYVCTLTFSDETSGEYPHYMWYQYHTVAVYKKPATPEITDLAEILEKGKLVPLGTCTVKDAVPAADITWLKNGYPLVVDGTDVVVSSAVKEDPTTGLLTTISSLRYAASRLDVVARFSCLSDHKLGQAESEPLTFPVHYSTERLSLVVTPSGPYKEGDVVTLKCHGDGNPPPSGYNFTLKGQTPVFVEDSYSYTLPRITRHSAGEYKCSLVVGDGEVLEALLSISVDYLDWNPALVIAGLVVLAIAVVAIMAYTLCGKRRTRKHLVRNRIYIPTVEEMFQESTRCIEV